MDTSAERLAQSSPTAKALLERFRAEGGTFEDAGSGGYFTDAKDGNPPVIGMSSRTPFGTQRGEAERQQTIAHELGHFAHARSGPPGIIAPSYDNGGKTDRQIESRREANFVQQNAERLLADEAHATEVSATIRDEVKAKTKLDIGVAGVLRGEKVPSRQELIDHYGRLTPSGHPQETYREYYSRPFREYYGRHFMPGGDGNLW